METRLSISIAMATCNGSDYLSEQLLSIEQQVCKPTELIIVDDSSCDETPDIIKSFSKSANFPVRIIKNGARIGPAQTFFKATKLCSSELIAFCDQDDIWHPQKLQRCERYFSDNEVVLVAHSMENFMVNQGQKKLLGGVKFYRGKPCGTHIRPDVVIPGMCMIIRKKWADHLEAVKHHRDRFYEINLRGRPEFTHDHWSHCHDLFYLVCSRLSGRIVFAPDVLAQHRLHASNHTNRQPELIGDSPVENKSRLGIHPPDSYTRFVRYCQDNVEFFRYLQSKEPSLVELCRVAVQYYRYWGEAYNLRAGLYSSRSHASAARLFYRLFSRGCYKSAYNKGFGAKSMAKDLVTVVLGPAQS